MDSRSTSNDGHLFRSVSTVSIGSNSSRRSRAEIERRRKQVDLDQKRLDVERRKAAILLEIDMELQSLDLQQQSADLDFEEAQVSGEDEDSLHARLRDFDNEEEFYVQQCQFVEDERRQTLDIEERRRRQARLEKEYEEEKRRLEEERERSRKTEDGMRKKESDEERFQKFLEEEDRRREALQHEEWRKFEERERSVQEEWQRKQFEKKEFHRKCEDRMRQPFQDEQRRLQFEGERRIEEDQRRRFEEGRKRLAQEVQRNFQEDERRKLDEAERRGFAGKHRRYYEDLDARKSEELARRNLEMERSGSILCSSVQRNESERDTTELLAKLSLPECEPSCFDDDKTKYYSWKTEIHSFILSRLSKAAEKLTYLQRYTGNDTLARSLVAPYVRQGSESALQAAWARLDSVFGNPVYVVKAYMENIKKFKPIPAIETSRLLDLSSKLTIMLTDMKNIEKSSLLDNDEYIRAVVKKLPIELIKSWEKLCRRKYKDTESIPFFELVDFIETEALARSNPRYGRDDIIQEKYAEEDTDRRNPPRQGGHGGQSARFKKTLKTHGSGPLPKRESSSTISSSICEFCNMANHSLRDCYKIQRCPLDVKRSFFLVRNYCTICGGSRTPDSAHRCIQMKCKICDGEHITAFHSEPGSSKMETERKQPGTSKAETSSKPDSNSNSSKALPQSQGGQPQGQGGQPQGQGGQPQGQGGQPQGQGGQPQGQGGQPQGQGGQPQGQGGQISCPSGQCSQSPELSAPPAEDDLYPSERSTISTNVTLINSKLSKIQDWSHVQQVFVYRKQHHDQKVKIYIGVDSESNTCWIQEQFAMDQDWLNECPRMEKMLLHTILSESSTEATPTSFATVNDIVMESIDGETVVDLPKLFVTGRIPISHANIADPKAVEKFDHLKSIANEFPAVDRSVPIVMLVGRNCPEAVGYVEVSPYPGKALPCALRTLFGWSIAYCGPDDGTRSICCKTDMKTVPLDNKSAILFEPKSKFDTEIRTSSVAQKLLEHIERDFVDENPGGDRKVSRNDLLFLEKVRKSTALVDGQYQMKLPFAGDPPILPNNREYALKRLKSLKKRLQEDTQYTLDYTEFFRMMLENGYLVELSEEEQNPPEKFGRFWYVPHHGTYKPRKKKIRIVYDVPAVFHGESLNSYLLTGPSATLTNTLFGCLVRLRKDNIAVMCDIEHMFNRVRVHPDHQDYFRLVWFEYNEDGSLNLDQVRDYKMTTHIFGATSSPSCANFALKMTALDNRIDFSEAAFEFVTFHFYVDDGCISAPTPDAAIRLSREVIEMLKRGGFRVHKFISNDSSVLNSLQPEERAIESVDVCESNSVLGLQWNPSKDVFSVRLELPERPGTRAGLLSIIHSIYDPCGFIAPVVLEGRKISQELCHRTDESSENLGWHDPIPVDLEERFDRWRTSLKSMDGLEIPRCFKPPGFGVVTSAELHHFGDASDPAYGCCSYLRLVNDEGLVNVSFVSGKSRVCPKTTTATLPRKELMAAKLNTELALQINREFLADSKISAYPDLQNFYYSDSTITLAYITNHDTPLKLFCANRAAYIAQNTDETKWFHTPGETNPSDFASRGIPAQQLTMEHPYLRGPDMLWSAEFTPETKNDYKIDVHDPEVKKETALPTKSTCMVTMVLPARESEILKCKLDEDFIEMIDRSCSWEVARNRARLVLKFIAQLKRKVEIKHFGNEASKNFQDNPLAEELLRAQLIIIQQYQLLSMPSELSRLQSSDVFTMLLTEQPELKKLCPFYDDTLKVVRVGGRLQNSEFPLEERHPVIIPKNCHLTFLIMDYYHRKTHHQGHSITLNCVRQAGLWIINGNSQVQKHLKSCVICRRLRSGELNQRMADLPIPRTIPGLFMYVGVDVFGPFEILHKRSTVKRYGCIFTCLGSRAIHIEKLVDMTTDRFLNGLRRFVNRRGEVVQFYMDRGTNFVGAANELAKALQCLDEDKIKEELAVVYNAEYFRFGFPYSSHKNGHTERQIRSVRNVLNNLLFQYRDRIDDDVLETFFTEAENIVNSRPLSVLSLSDPEIQPISPIQILTQKSSVVTTLPGDFDVNDMYLRKAYKKSQFLANEFWDRWKVQYLQEMQKRDKWMSEKRNLQEGDIVVIRDDSEHRNKWPLARVEKVVEDHDGLIRKAQVRCGESLFDRPVHRLHLIVPVEEQ